MWGWQGSPAPAPILLAPILVCGLVVALGPKMHDHDRIEEMLARLVGVFVAFREVVSGLEKLAEAHPAVAEKLSRHLARARAAMASGELDGERARAAGEERWRVNPGIVG